MSSSRVDQQQGRTEWTSATVRHLDGIGKIKLSDSALVNRTKATSRWAAYTLIADTFTGTPLLPDAVIVSRTCFMLILAT